MPVSLVKRIQGKKLQHYSEWDTNREGRQYIQRKRAEKRQNVQILFIRLVPQPHRMHLWIGVKSRVDWVEIRLCEKWRKKERKKEKQNKTASTSKYLHWIFRQKGKLVCLTIWDHNPECISQQTKKIVNKHTKSKRQEKKRVYSRLLDCKKNHQLSKDQKENASTSQQQKQ